MNIHSDEGMDLLMRLAAVDPDAPVTFTLRAADAARARMALAGPHPSPADQRTDEDLLDVATMGTIAGRSKTTVTKWLREGKADGKLPGAYKLSGVDWRCPRGEFVALVKSKTGTKGRAAATPEPRVKREPIGAWRGAATSQGARSGSERKR
jgi:hypothetical protein